MIEGEILSELQAQTKALTRMADASEKLNALAIEERDITDINALLGPPICPHCQALSPRISNGGGDGSFGEFILAAECQECHNVFFAVAQGWTCFTTPESVQAEIGRRSV